MPEMSKIKIYDDESGDNYQVIYIDNELYQAIHFNDDQLGFTAIRLLQKLGHEVKQLGFDEMSDERREFLVMEGFIYE